MASKQVDFRQDVFNLKLFHGFSLKRSFCSEKTKEKHQSCPNIRHSKQLTGYLLSQTVQIMHKKFSFHTLQLFTNFRAPLSLSCSRHSQINSNQTSSNRQKGIIVETWWNIYWKLAKLFWLRFGKFLLSEHCTCFFHVRRLNNMFHVFNGCIGYVYHSLHNKTSFSVCQKIMRSH